MRDIYRTVSRRALIKMEEKRSVFLGYCQPLADEKQAEDFVSGIREQYPDATHHVYAWIIGGERNLQRYSDDGEPQGTAGIPVLDVLRKNGIQDAGLVVVRYFGGVLLGGGGLVRAYSKAASMALEQAEPVTMQLCRRFKLTVPYTDYDRLRWHLNQGGYWLGDVSYGMDVEIVVGAVPDQVDALLSMCADQTSGAVLAEEEKPGYVPLPPPDPPPAPQ
jgi:uncharacterized YigZ family protein